ncbi:MAG: ATP-grasp domain-containing protein [Bacilli bacterium]|jgi:D-aspartate ligase
MKFVEKDFIPVLLGGDISNYSMARSFYEAYNIKSLVIGKHPIYPTTYTKLIDGIYDEKIENPKVFISLLHKIDELYPHKKKIILGNNDNYVRLIIENKKHFPKSFIAPYIDLFLFEKLIVKEHFYNMCEQYGLDYPKTYIFNCSKASDTNIKLPFAFPAVAKPSDTVKYSHYEFDGKQKGYIINDQVELKRVLDIVCGSGYSDSLIIQDYIPGDDSNMRVITCYCDKKSKVKGIAMAHILLEDHTPMLVGNYTAMMSEYNKEVSDQLVTFLEKIKFVGICHFDVKYDARDKKYKVFEMNIRQGRNNYYTTASGCNLATYIVNDYILNKPMKLSIAKKECVSSIIPKCIVFKYVKDEGLLHKVRKLIKDKKWIRPLLMKGDYNIGRLRRHMKSDLGSINNYRKYYK